MASDRASNGVDRAEVRRLGLRSLTARELEVLALLSTGASTQSIADQLHITPSTVKRHLTNLYRKLGATNRVAAVREYLLVERDRESGALDRSRITDRDSEL